MDPAQVRVVSPYIGGAFGSKGPLSPRSAIVALAARRIGRPVRCVVSRAQGYTTATYRAETRHRIRIGTDRDGRITAFGHEGWEVTSRPDDYLVGGTDVTTRLYGYGAVDSKVRLLRSDRNTPGYMRSPPETPYVFALECAMDEMAEAAGMDPVEFRRTNDTMHEPVDGAPYTSRSLMRCYDEAAEAFGWRRRDPTVGAMADGDWLVGAVCRRPRHGAERLARDRHRHPHRRRPGRCRTPRPRPRRRRGGDGRHRAAAGAGLRRLELHRQRLLGGHPGLQGAGRAVAARRRHRQRQPACRPPHGNRGSSRRHGGRA
jgi:hypothetical protein